MGPTAACVPACLCARCPNKEVSSDLLCGWRRWVPQVRLGYAVLIVIAAAGVVMLAYYKGALRGLVGA